jgi:hypothetical protein
MGALEVGEAAMSSRSEVPGGARRSTEESSRMRRPMVKVVRCGDCLREVLEGEQAVSKNGPVWRIEKKERERAGDHAALS